VKEVILPRDEGSTPRIAGALRTGRSLLRRVPLWVAHTWCPRFAAAVQSTVAEWRPDVVQFEYHVMGQYLAALGTPRPSTVLRQLEAGAAAARDRVSQERGLDHVVRLLDWAAWRRYERLLVQRVDAVAALTERDVRAMRELTSAVQVLRIPLGIELPKRPADPVGVSPASLLFVGNFMHPPNTAAAVRLVDRILPRIRVVLPETRLTIVGPHPPTSIFERAGEGVTVTGEVPQLEPFVDAAAVVVAPLDRGGGMRVKVAEALAAGKAVVASPRALEGLAVRSDEHVLIAETDEQIAEACLRLLRDPGLRASLAARARHWAADHLGWDGPVADFERLYASLTS
jgi:glycosyltransferase involved in cell wall biosynthesis